MAKVVAHLHLEKVEKAVDQKAVTTEAPLKKEATQAHTLPVRFQVDKTAVVLAAVVDITLEMSILLKAQLKITTQNQMEAIPMGKYDFLGKSNSFHVNYIAIHADFMSNCVFLFL